MSATAARVMYHALANRDPAYDGIFYVAVKTTRIFCRSVVTPAHRNARTSSSRPSSTPCMRGTAPAATAPGDARQACADGRKAKAAVEADPSEDCAGRSDTHGNRPITARRQFSVIAA
jgi:AraC family transcriptional regulator of adaptative response / DNA-3-methyladenine glycosylase II